MVRPSQKDTDLLATLYEMPHWAAVLRLLEQRQLEYAQEAPFAVDMTRVSELKGRIIEARGIASEVQKINEKQEKLRKQKS